MITLRKFRVFLFYMVVNVVFVGLMFAHAHHRRQADEALFAKKQAIVKNLELTDLCLFTDARYTRHPTMADLNTPFQDYPLSFEHFPSGSLLSLPPHLREREQD